MLALYIIFGIIAFFYLILHIPVRVILKHDGEKFFYKVKYMCFTLFPVKKNKKKKKPKKKKKSKAQKNEIITEEDKDLAIKEAKETLADDVENIEKSEDFTEEKKSELDETLEQIDEILDEVIEDKEKKAKISDQIKKVKEMYESAKPYLPTAGRTLQKLLKAIKIKIKYLYLGIADEDACQCALKYGKISAIFYNVYNLLGGIFTLKAKKIHLESKFNQDKMEYKVDVLISVLPSTILAILISAAVKALKIYLKSKDNTQKKSKKKKKNINKKVMKKI